MPGRSLIVGVESAVCPISSRIGESAASTMLRNAELMASVMHAPMSVIPQSESPSPLPVPGCCGPVLGGGVVGCGMQSSPVHGWLGVVVGVDEVQPTWPGKLHVVGAGSPVGSGSGAVGSGLVVVGAGSWQTGSGEPGVHGSTVGIGSGGCGGGCCGAVGEAHALTARTPTRSTTMLSASIQPARQGRGRPAGGRSALASETGESIARSPSIRPAAAVATGPPDRRYGRTVGGVLTAIGQAPTIPLRISTTSGASAARP